MGKKRIPRICKSSTKQSYHTHYSLTPSIFSDDPDVVVPGEEVTVDLEDVFLTKDDEYESSHKGKRRISFLETFTLTRTDPAIDRRFLEKRSSQKR